MKLDEFFNTNKYLFLPVVQSLEQGKSKLLFFDDDGAVVKQSDYLVNLCLTSDKALLKYKKLVENHLCVIYGANDLQYIAKLFPDGKQTPCTQVVYIKKEPPVIKTDAEFRLLDRSYAQFVYDTYSRRPPMIEPIIELLDMNYIFGVFIDGKIAGFCGRHQEGSMGLLEVLPEYRKMGLGRLMVKYTVAQVLKEGKLPYGHVVFGNEISLKLQQGIDGMVALPQTVLWHRMKK